MPHTEISTVLVTGANGYVAAWVLNDLLEAGYSVKATVRTESAARIVFKTHSKFADKLSTLVVSDITAPGAFDGAAHGVEAVIHVASPFSTNVSDFESELLLPAILGTTNVLKSAARNLSVQRVVITSSFAAMYDFAKGVRPGHTYRESDHNPTTYEEAKLSSNWSMAYCASKALAERAAWEYVNTTKPSYTLSVINPPKIYGPSFKSPENLSHLKISSADVWQLINGSLSCPPRTAFWAWVDVRDVSLAHLRALESSEAQGSRFFVTGGRYSYTQICDILRQSTALPAHVLSRIPKGFPSDVPDSNVYNIDNSRSMNVLKMRYRTLENSILDAALQLLDVEAKECSSDISKA